MEPIEHPRAGPFHHNPRRDLLIELSWNTFKEPFELFRRYSTDPAVAAFWSATRFYARALRSFDRDPEVSFLDLVIAMEILSGQMKFQDDELFDAASLALFKRLREELKDGAKVERFVRQRFFQLRRKISLSATALTNDYFFAGSEADHDFGRLSKDALSNAVKAAYDIRSRYAHSGSDFGRWVTVFAESNEEVQLGHPKLDDAELAELIHEAPTLIGLERLTRFMILKFAHSRIAPIHSLLA